MKHEVFLKSKLNLHTSQKLHFSFRIYKILSYLVSFADFTQTNLSLFLLRSPILHISIILFPISLNRLNTVLACHKLKPIGNAQNLNSNFI